MVSAALPRLPMPEGVCAVELSLSRANREVMPVPDSLAAARLPHHGESLFGLDFDPALPPEAAFWWRILGVLGPALRETVPRERPEGVRVATDRRALPRHAVRVGRITADVYTDDAAEGAEAEVFMRVGLFAPAWIQGLRGLDAQVLRHGLYQLLGAWQGERIIVPPAGSLPASAADIYLVPAGVPFSEQDAYRVVAAALHAIVVRGVPPAEAVVRAQAEAGDTRVVPHPTSRLARRAAWAGRWRLGWARPSPEFQWLFGTRLAQAWRDQQLVCGFRVAPATWPEPYPKTAWACPRPGASQRQPWAVVARFRVGRWIPGSTIPQAVLVPLQPPSLRWKEAGGALYRVLAAWPGGQKALLVQRETLSHPDPVRRDALVGLRLAGAPADAIVSVFAEAVRFAQGGAPPDALRRWLGRIGSAEARALQVLRALS